MAENKDPNSSPDFTPPQEEQKHTAPGVIYEDSPVDFSSLRCSRIIGNRMRCPRMATRRQPDDTEGRNVVCDVCWELEGKPSSYSILLGE